MNPISTEQAHQRVLRGGGWGLDATANRLANRRKSLIKDRGDAAGFRVVQVS